MRVNDLAGHIPPGFNVADDRRHRFWRQAVIYEDKNDQKTGENSGKPNKLRPHPETLLYLHTVG
jgi:hypothetical protein